jgi:hypothetical protein
VGVLVSPVPPLLQVPVLLSLSLPWVLLLLPFWSLSSFRRRLLWTWMTSALAKARQPRWQRALLIPIS